MGLRECLIAIGDRIDPKTKQDLLKAAKEESKTKPVEVAEAKIKHDHYEQVLNDQEYILQAIRSQLGIPAPEKKVSSARAPDKPDNAKPEAPAVAVGPGETTRVYARAPVEKSFIDKFREFTGIGGGGMQDAFANKFLGKAHSLLKKAHEAGEQNAVVAERSRVSASFANAQGNNAMGLAAQALDVGYMAISKLGDIKAVHDSKHTMKELTGKMKALRTALAEKGYREKELNDTDTHTIDNMLSVALFGPRMEELVKNGWWERARFPEHDRAESERLRADPELAPLIKDFHDAYNFKREKALDALVASGTFTPEKAKEFMDRSEYMPLYRMDEEAMNNQGEPLNLNSLLTAKREHHLTHGSESYIGDPLENAFNNLVWLNTRAIKNNTANILAESLVAAGHAEFGAASPTKAKNVVEFLRDGEPAFLHLKDINDASAFTATPVLTGTGWKLARAFSNALRRGVTIMPGFVWGQTSQDAQRVAVRTGQGIFVSYKDVALGLKNNMWADTPDAATLRNYGLAGARDFVDTTENFRKEMLDKPDSTWHKYLRQNFLKPLEAAAVASDMASREAAYKKAYADAMKRTNGDMTVSELEGVHAARQMIDFNNRGNSRSLAALMTVVPFVNARIQGTHRLYDALTGKIPGMDKEAAQKMALMQVGKIMAFTLAYAMYKKDDPEYENETTIVRNNNFMLGPFKVPVAGELIPFKVISETIARQMIDSPNEDWTKSRASVMDAVSSVLLGPADMMPSVIRPVVEAATDHSFTTGRSLIGKSVSRGSAAYQYNESTTHATRALAEGIQEAAQALGFKEGVSPIVIENFITGFLGRAGSEALNLVRNVESVASMRPAPTRSQIAIVGSFMTNPQGNALRSDFQEVVDRVGMVKARLDQLRTERRGDEIAKFIRDNQKILALQGRILPLQQRLSTLTKQGKVEGKTAAQRDELYKRQLAILQPQVAQLRKEAGL